jgi:amino acid transporter
MYFDATNSKAGSICLIVFSIICMVFTATAIMTTSARMTYAFSRDRGLPFSHVWAKYNDKLEVPLNALLWTTGWVIVFGLILLGSSSAFNAITAASVVALGKFFTSFVVHAVEATNIQKVSLMQSPQLSTFSVAETYFPKTVPSSSAPPSDGSAVLSVLPGLF